MVNSKAHLIQVFPPLVGQTLFFRLEGAQPGEVRTWQWMIEEHNGDKTHWKGIKGNQLGVKIQEEYLHKRIRAVVELQNGRKITQTSFHVLTSEEYSRDINLEALKEYSVLIQSRISEYQSSSKELLVRKEEFERAKEVPRKLDLIEQRLRELRSENESLQIEKVELSEAKERLRNEREAFDQWVGFESERVRFAISELKLRQEVFERDHTLQGRIEQKNLEIAELKKQIDQVENAWDILDKANHLKVRLSAVNKDAILAIVAAATEEARKQKKASLESPLADSKSCHHYAVKSSLVGWAGVCSDCSK